MASDGSGGRSTIFSTLGVAAFVAGLALAGSAIGAIVDAPAKRNLTVEWVILGLGVAMAGAAVYVFLAALSEHLPLPGMRAIRLEDREHVGAELLLTMAIRRGNDLAEAAEIPIDEMSKWMVGVLELIRDTWGSREESLIWGSVREMPKPGSSKPVESHFPLAALHPVLLRLEDFLKRCPSVPLDKSHKQLDIDKWVALFSLPPPARAGEGQP